MANVETNDHKAIKRNVYGPGSAAQFAVHLDCNLGCNRHAFCSVLEQKYLTWHRAIDGTFLLDCRVLVGSVVRCNAHNQLGIASAHDSLDLLRVVARVVVVQLALLWRFNSQSEAISHPCKIGDECL